MDNLNISGIVSESIVDGAGIRYVIFTQGCNHNCAGCHNPHTHDINGGKIKSIDEIFNAVRINPMLKGVTFSGGEPFLQAEKLIPLAKMLKLINKDIWAYTGYTFEFLQDDKVEYGKELLQHIDVLVDGKFELQNRDLTLRFRGSTNQRIIDCKQSIEQGKIILAIC